MPLDFNIKMSSVLFAASFHTRIFGVQFSHLMQYPNGNVYGFCVRVFFIEKLSCSFQLSCKSLSLCSLFRCLEMDGFHVIRWVRRWKSNDLTFQLTITALADEKDIRPLFHRMLFGEKCEQLFYLLSQSNQFTSKINWNESDEVELWPRYRCSGPTLWIQCWLN